MRGLAAVLHEEATIEGDAGLVSRRNADLRLVQAAPRRGHGLGDPVGDERDVLRVGLAFETARDRAAAVRMTGAHEHLVARNLGCLLDRGTGAGGGLIAD